MVTSAFKSLRFFLKQCKEFKQEMTAALKKRDEMKSKQEKNK